MDVKVIPQTEKNFSHMFYIYLDESGDLGFDFEAKKPSKFFTITLLLIP